MNEREYALMYRAEETHWWYVGLHELILHFVAAEAKQRGRLTIFDAGCGTGRLCQLMQAHGAVAGCDLSASALDLARQRGLSDISCQDLNRLELPPATYDVITSIDVLYHRWVTDDVAVLRRLHGALKPGGILILNLVAWPFLYSDHDVAVHTRERYTRPVLRQRLVASGFAIERLTYRVSLLFPPIALYRLLSRRPDPDAPAATVASDVEPPPAGLNRLLLQLMRLENALLAHWSLPVGTSLFAVARRL
jgi:2-polyprenyl-3-methyl-5-hydroxy-6-metoxy-1,4-benzoquinol methylase